MLLRKVIKTVQVYISNFLAYRLNFFLEFSMPSLFFFLIKYNIWTGIYGGVDSELVLRSYTLKQMMNYQSWTLVVGLLTQSFHGGNLAAEVRLGKITSALLYPFDFWMIIFSRFVAFIAIQFIVALSSVLFLSQVGLLTIPDIGLIPSALFVTLLAAFFWCTYNYLTGILAFWFEETWFFRVFMIVVGKIFSGSLMPLEFFPAAVRSLVLLSPLPYLSYYPVKIILSSETSVLLPVVALCIWNIICVLVCALLWRQGLKRYTGAGA